MRAADLGLEDSILKNRASPVMRTGRAASPAPLILRPHSHHCSAARHRRLSLALARDLRSACSMVQVAPLPPCREWNHCRGLRSLDDGCCGVAELPATMQASSLTPSGFRVSCAAPHWRFLAGLVLGTQLIATRPRLPVASSAATVWATARCPCRRTACPPIASAPPAVSCS